MATINTYGQQRQDQSSATGLKSTFDRWQFTLARVSANMLSKEVDSVTQQLASEKKMSGNSFGIYLDLIQSRSEYFEWSVNAGYEVFSVAGQDSQVHCPNGSSEICNAEINYLSLGLMPRVKLSNETFLVWSGIGLNIKQPLAKKATAILVSEINTTSTYGFALGVDLFFSRNIIIPIEVQQQYFFNSDSVEARQLLLKVGFGQRF